jgi:hypothetical protein
MTDAHSAKTPLDKSYVLQPTGKYDKKANVQLYQELIGSLNHLAVFSRPDISFAVSQLSQFLQLPSETHMKAARHVLRYLKGTRDVSITYGRAQNIRIFGFSDSDWGGNKIDRKSITGYIYMINNGAVSWSSHKQTTVATSTMEAEYMALSDAAREALARSHLYGVLISNIPTPLVFSDNKGALEIATNPTNYQKTKHIDIRYHFIRHSLQNDHLAINHVPGEDNPADFLTKPLTPFKHQHCMQLIKLA